MFCLFPFTHSLIVSESSFLFRFEIIHVNDKKHKNDMKEKEEKKRKIGDIFSCSTAIWGSMVEGGKGKGEMMKKASVSEAFIHKTNGSL